MSKVHVHGTSGVTSINGQSGAIEVGGVNLISGTNQGINNWVFDVDSKNNPGAYSTASETLEDGTDALGIEILKNLTGYFLFSYRLNVTGFTKKIEPNTSYVVSFSIKSTIVADMSVQICSTNGGNELSDFKQISLSGDDTWQRFALQLTTNDLTHSLSTQGLRFVTSNFPSGHITVKNLQIEKGNVPTGWRPSLDEILTRLVVLEEKNGITYEPPQISGPEIMDEFIQDEEKGRV